MNCVDQFYSSSSGDTEELLLFHSSPGVCCCEHKWPGQLLLGNSREKATIITIAEQRFCCDPPLFGDNFGEGAGDGMTPTSPSATYIYKSRKTMYSSYLIAAIYTGSFVIRNEHIKNESFEICTRSLSSCTIVSIFRNGNRVNMHVKSD